MRIILIAAILGSALFQTYQVSGQTDSAAQVAKPTSQQPAQGETAANGDPQVAKEETTNKSRFNIPIKTGGGTQVWTDHAYRDGYRIQENALTGHFRLLDEKNVRKGGVAKYSASTRSMILNQSQPNSLTKSNMSLSCCTD